MRLHLALVLLSGCQLVLPIHENDASSSDASLTVGSVLCGSASCPTTGNSNGPGCCTIQDLDAGAIDYACEPTKEACSEAGGPSSLIICDEPNDCSQSGAYVCCLVSGNPPATSYCFKNDAGNCYTELCNPDDAVPCKNHPGTTCMPLTPGTKVYKDPPPGLWYCG